MRTLSDEATWPAYATHPLDPRTLEPTDTEDGLRYLMDSAYELMRRAEQCMAQGDLQASIDLLQSAGKELASTGWA